MNRLLEASQAEIAESGANEITLRSRLQSPQIELTLAARQPPALSLFSRHVAKVGSNRRWEQVQRALSVLRHEGIQKNQSLQLCCICLSHSAYNHSRVAVSYQHYRFADV